MCKHHVFIVLGLILYIQSCVPQIILFGKCVEVESMKYFNMDSFLGKWYEIQRFPAWFEQSGQCAYKRFQACGRRIEIEHSFVRDDIHFVLHVNSTYTPGDEAVLHFQENNIDPFGIPMSVISTDYTNYALVYGCKYKEDLDLKYLTAWIMSREPSLPDLYLEQARAELNSLPYASVAYLQPVSQAPEKCSYQWTAHVQAVNVNETSGV